MEDDENISIEDAINIAIDIAIDNHIIIPIIPIIPIIALTIDGNIHALSPKTGKE